MRSILALRAKGLVLPAIHGSLVQAFRSLGIDVLDLQTPEGEEGLACFVQVAKRHQWDALFSLDLGGSQFLVTRLNEIQDLLKIPWIVWFVDDPEGYGFPQVCESRWTLTFCWDQAIVAQCGSWGGWPVTHLPLATDPCLFQMGRSRSGPLFPGGVFVGSTAHENQLLDSVAESIHGLEREVERLWLIYSKDFRQSPYNLAWSLAAQSSRQPRAVLERDPMWRLWVMACVRQLGIRKRIEVVSKVMGKGSGVFGDDGWREKVGEGLYRGSVPYGEQVCDIYNRSAFVLEVRQPQSRSGLTQRLYDGSACGRTVIAEWSSELPGLFDVETEVLAFRNVQECVEMRDRCVRDAREARRRGERAMARVLSHHTYVHRARTILDEYAKYTA